jgi:hypothetical protein
MRFLPLGLLLLLAAANACAQDYRLPFAGRWFVVNAGTGQNIVFTGMNVEMTGKQFRKVDWPVIRGIFVWNE